MTNWREHLGRVSWHTLECCEGNAAHVPAALIDLFSTDWCTRMAAYWKLDNYVVCQSDLYEPAYHCLPFVFAGLDEKDFQDCPEAIELLFEIANGSGGGERIMVDGEEVDLTCACLSYVRDRLPMLRRGLALVDDRSRETIRDLVVYLGGDMWGELCATPK